MLTQIKPNEKYFKLGPRQAAAVARRVARQADGRIDWRLLKDWTQAYQQAHSQPEQVSFFEYIPTPE